MPAKKKPEDETEPTKGWGIGGLSWSPSPSAKAQDTAWGGADTSKFKELSEEDKKKARGSLSNWYKGK